MVFEKGYLYHIYNQGNNRQRIFFNRRNYLFFIKKINDFILPYADILAWCLMPNHFHLMVLVNHTVRVTNRTHRVTNRTHRVTNRTHRVTNRTHRVTNSHPVSTRTFNNSIAILLRSYTRAINKQENRTGALFRESTKATCINCLDEKLQLGKKNNIINIPVNSQVSDYPQACFNYIHQNPVEVNLVKNAIDWEFSSARSYAKLRNGLLINKKIAAAYLSEPFIKSSASDSLFNRDMTHGPFRHRGNG